jgi:hypothetical protein
VLVALIEFDCDIDCSTLPLWLMLPWPLLLMSTLALLLASFDCVLKLASAPGMIICSAYTCKKKVGPLKIWELLTESGRVGLIHFIHSDVAA